MFSLSLDYKEEELQLKLVFQNFNKILCFLFGFKLIRNVEIICFGYELKWKIL